MSSNSKRNKLASGITNSLNIQAMAEVMATVIGRGIIAAILYGWTLDDNKQTIHCTNTTTYHTVGTDVTEQGWSTADSVVDVGNLSFNKSHKFTELIKKTCACKL